MPIGPNRSASVESMMQYTYLPRLETSGGAITGVRPPWTTFSATRRSTRIGFTAALAVRTAPFPFAGLAVTEFVGWRLLRLAGVIGARVRVRLRAPLVDALGILAAPA